MGGVGARRKARECALQILYSLDVNSGLTVDQALSAFWRGFEDEKDPSVIGFAEALVRGTMRHREAIDEVIQRSSRNWRLERMARVDRNILRLATYELMYEREVPAKVVINEAIEVAKRYGTAESAAFVNGLLDRISQELGRV